jgi:hypothetical protein
VLGAYNCLNLAASATAPSLCWVTLPAAIDAVTDPANLSAFGFPGASMRAVRSSAVVDELRKAEGLSASEAKRRGREAVAHVGGQVETRSRPGGLAAGRMRVRHEEVWWVPRSAIRA